MPNVRHEESLDGIILPEIIQSASQFSPQNQKFAEDELITNGDDHVYESQYREDLKL
jgi:hypothetical protein